MMNFRITLQIFIGLVWSASISLTGQQSITLESGIKIGNDTSDTPVAGTLRWTGEDLQVYTNDFWVSLLTGEAVGSVVTDIDGNTYGTVQIGNQIWMAENLRTTRFRDGTLIPLVEDLADWNSLSTPAYSWYANDNSLENVYGKLYNWFTVDDPKGLCPEGWHVPSIAEAIALSTHLGGDGVSGGKLKSTGTEYWNHPNTGATNESGFSALPGGLKSTAFVAGGLGAYFFTTDLDGNAAQYFILRYTNDDMIRNSASQKTGVSVRCIKD